VDMSNQCIDLSVSIVNTNNRALLERCLDTIATSICDIPHEIIVVDNASTDGSLDLLRSKYASVITIANETRDGYGRSHNRAIQAARGKYVLILNEDMEMLGDAVAQMYRIAQSIPDLGVLGCRILNPDRSLQHSCFKDPTLLSELFEALFPYTLAFRQSPLRSKMHYWPHDAARDVDIVLGCCMLVPRSVFQEIGAFDPDFYIYSEEHDFCKRARNRGFRVFFTPVAEMIHFGGQTTKRMSLAMALIQVESRLRYFRKHRGRLTAFVFRAILVLGAGVRLTGWAILFVSRHRRDRSVSERLSEYLASLRFALGILHSR